MAWHMGHPLSQSLFTSYHIDRLLWPNPRTLEEANFDRRGRSGPVKGMLHVVFRAYCLALIKCCDFVHRRIGTEHYYEVSSLKAYNEGQRSAASSVELVLTTYRRKIL